MIKILRKLIFIQFQSASMPVMTDLGLSVTFDSNGRASYAIKPTIEIVSLTELAAEAIEGFASALANAIVSFIKDVLGL